jgi:predicted nucleic acid-binding protein
VWRGGRTALARASASIEALADDVDVAIAAVTATELLVGVELADAAQRQQRQAFVGGVLERAETIAFDLEIARHRAAMLAQVRDATAFTDLAEVNHRLVK